MKHGVKRILVVMALLGLAVLASGCTGGWTSAIQEDFRRFNRQEQSLYPEMQAEVAAYKDGQMKYMTRPDPKY